MNPKFFPSNAEVIYQGLNQRSHQDTNLFSEEEQPSYWNLSDLALMYPNFFDMKSPISAETIKKINKNVLNHVPEFIDITTDPIHVLNIKATYNIYIKDTEELKTVKNGTNQKLTRVACEHLFRQYKGAEFEQAYFMFPHKSVDELIQASHTIRFERIRDQVAASSNILSAIINRSNGARNFSFGEVWSAMWRAFYNVRDMDELRTRFNIKKSPLDYMKPQTLIYVNSLLQEIILKFCNDNFVHIDEIRDFATTKMLLARARFIRYGSKPEEQLLEKSSYHTIEKVRDARIKFWQEHFPISLTK